MSQKNRYHILTASGSFCYFNILTQEIEIKVPSSGICVLCKPNSLTSYFTPLDADYAIFLINLLLDTKGIDPSDNVCSYDGLRTFISEQADLDEFDF